MSAMFLHVFCCFPRPRTRRLRGVEAVFDDTRPGSIRYTGTPAWRTRNDHGAALRADRNEPRADEKPKTATREQQGHGGQTV